MTCLPSYLSRLVVIFVLLSAISNANAAEQGVARLIIVRTANFGRNVAAHIKIDGRAVADVVQGRRYDQLIAAGRHVLTVSAVPNNELRQPTSLTVRLWPGGTYSFTAMWDSDRVYLRPTTL